MLLQVIHYYLVDDTIEVREVHQPNDGRDPFPVLICRQRLNKNRKDLPGTEIVVTGLHHHQHVYMMEWLLTRSHRDVTTFS